MDRILSDTSNTVIAGITVIALLSWKLVSWTSARIKTFSYNKVRKQKKDELYKINFNWAHQVSNQINKEDAHSIVNLGFSELQQKLQDGDVTATKVLHAYQYVAAEQNTSCRFICEPISEAEASAVKLDSLSAAERRKLPLFGIPISVKENYMLEGYDATLGCVDLINKPCKETAIAIQILRAHGAVPFIRTNVPQTCMSIDSTNPIYGITCNPHNSARSCGGSSGGEGSAIGSCSSILGFGSDIGGSLRVPAACCGIYSLKPTAGRLTLRGDRGVDMNERIVTVTIGPMGRDVNALIEAMRAFSTTDAYALDPYTPPITFNEQELNSNKKLRIGYFHYAEPIELSASSRRSVDIAIQCLKGAGHELVAWQPPDVLWALGVAYASDIFADGCETLAKSVEYDVLEDHLKEMVYLSYVPAWLKRLLCATILRLFFPERMIKFVRATCGTGSVAKFWRLEADIKAFRGRVVDELKQLGIDALVCPALPNPAMRIGEVHKATAIMCYFGLFNLLNFPCGVVPVTKVTAEDLKIDAEQFPAKDMWHSAMKSNLEGSEGLPMAVQCVTLPYHDEQCLRLMKQMETLIGYDVVKERSTS